MTIYRKECLIKKCSNLIHSKDDYCKSCYQDEIYKEINESSLRRINPLMENMAFIPPKNEY